MSDVTGSLSKGPTIREATVDIPAAVNDGNNAKPDALAQATSDGARPSWLPEGYASVEEYVEKANAALATQQPQAEPAPTENTEGATPKGDGDKETETDPAAPQTKEEVSKAVGFDITPFSEEFARDGKLSEESYKALADKHGFPREVVDMWIRGQRAAVSEWQGSLFAEAGGKAEYDALMAWASTNIPADDYAALGVTLTDPKNIVGAKMAVRGLKATYEAKEGREAKLIGATSGNASASDAFATRDEQRKAIADPRYRTDPTYRASVEAKSMRSNFAAG